MIRTTATPQNNVFNLEIPNEYVGRQIEILVYSLDEVVNDPIQKPLKTMADFWGTISDESANHLHQIVAEGRNEWEEYSKK